MHVRNMPRRMGSLLLLELLDLPLEVLDLRGLLVQLALVLAHLVVQDPVVDARAARDGRADRRADGRADEDVAQRRRWRGHDQGGRDHGHGCNDDRRGWRWRHDRRLVDDRRALDDPRLRRARRRGTLLLLALRGRRAADASATARRLGLRRGREGHEERRQHGHRSAGQARGLEGIAPGCLLATCNRHSPRRDGGRRQRAAGSGRRGEADEADGGRAKGRSGKERGREHQRAAAGHAREGER
mmetsp:Transcript_8490/g.27055  ORF Transcript_8490/g.27055 Transcript_8490/m.27055 type:complete len:243 (-) Transcript_8490:61-789(-)